MNQINHDKLEQAARDMKAQQIRLCRRYLSIAKGMNLTPNSPTIRSWTNQLTDWRELPTYQAMRHQDAIEASGLTASEAEEVLANL